MIIEVFPLETNGNGSPVGGILPVTTNALIITCIPKIMVIPTANINPKIFFEFFATFNPLKTINISRPKKPTNPIKPISSPITERIKSDSAKGKKAYFCLELNNPTPNQPPDPKA